MDLLRRLFGGSQLEQPRTSSFVTFNDQREDCELDIVGEDSYQPALEIICGPLGPDGPAILDHQAILLPEPDNPNDRNAIAAYIRQPDGTTHKVGYLARHMAVAYGPLFATIAPRGIACPAWVKGGWDRGPGDRGSIGVVLRLGSPGELAAELWLEDHPISTRHPWPEKMVVFTGDSLFALGPVPLDRMGQRYLAERAGCQTWPHVTKKVDVCVASHPDEETGNLKKAEQYRIEIVPESDFWPALGLALDRH